VAPRSKAGCDQAATAIVPYEPGDRTKHGDLAWAALCCADHAEDVQARRQAEGLYVKVKTLERGKVT
jgi:hypothetical protein